MEHRLDDIWMDVQGCELSVANAHQQIQRVEDKVVAPLSKKVSDMYQDFFTSGSAMETLGARGDALTRYIINTL